VANLIFGGHKIGSSSLQFSAARGVFSEVENTTQPVGAGDGEMLIRSRLKSRIIPVTYDFVALSRREFERQLAPLLYSSGVQKLIIDDRPDEFWYAKVDGKIDMDRAYFLGTGTINFLVPDGIAHSVATKTANNMPYKDASNLLLEDPVGTQVATGGNWLIKNIGTFYGKPGEQYTASVNIEKLDNTVSFQVFTGDANGVRQDLVSYVGITTSQKAFITFSAPENGAYSTILLQLSWTNGDVSGSYSWSEAKAELGDIATPYKDVPVNLLIGSGTSQTVPAQSWGDNPYLLLDTSSLEIGDTVSFQVKVSGLKNTNVFVALNGKQISSLFSNGMETFTITWTKELSELPLPIEFSVKPSAKTDEYIWSQAKVENGTTASPWSPNPADPEYYTDTITVHNGGTYPVEPVITATMHADNGLIAFINSQGGVLQFGNPEEADGVERQRSEVARYEGFDKEPTGAAYNTGQTNSHYYYIAAQKNVMEGSVKYADDDGSAVEPVFLPTNSHYWEGPSLHLKTTNASNGSNTGSFLAKWRYKFNSSVNALGAIEMTLDNDTGVAYQVIIRSNYAGKDDVDVQVFAGSTLVFQQTLNRSVFSNGRYYEAKLTKLGNTLNLQLAGIVQGGIKPSEVVTRNPPLIMPPIMLTSDEASLPITRATLWFQRFENYPYPDMGVYDMDIEWLNVDYWTDLSNRFSSGDVATIDVANRQILVNGVINADLQLIDNDWKKFRLLPGDTQILAQRSSWAQPYELEVAFREAFL
jgi:predicted phage tail component-like protein